MENAAEVLRPHVYLIDSDGSVQDSVRMLGDVLGFDVSCFSSAETFLDTIESVQGHIVCAAELPGIDGVTLHRLLRRRGNRLPFALLLSRDNAPLRRAARRDGIDPILEKPRADTALLDFIARPLAIG